MRLPCRCSFHAANSDTGAGERGRGRRRGGRRRSPGKGDGPAGRDPHGRRQRRGTVARRGASSGTCAARVWLSRSGNPSRPAAAACRTRPSRFWAACRRRCRTSSRPSPTWSTSPASRPRSRRSVRRARCWVPSPTSPPLMWLFRACEERLGPPATKAGLRRVRGDVHDLLAQAVEQRLRDIVQDLITISKVRGGGTARRWPPCRC